MRNKCGHCGLVNTDTDETCRRCGASLSGEAQEIDSSEVKEKKRGIGRRVIWIVGTTLLLLLISYLSLLITSDDLEYDKRKTVERAVAVLEQRGFEREVFVLKHLVKYRGTDNWWNRYVGHHDAYAATNFPFEIVTLYPDFFYVAIDDNERAAILLHEAYHLFGAGEEAALERTWREKHRIGWTEDQYGQTKVWANTRELTMAQLPNLFQCGTDGKSDCVQ
ncbi:MAG TPA: hypothetical protein VGJ66_22295 [Pyrinomonadaceae bacterium]|jgi:hypothetical protein